MAALAKQTIDEALRSDMGKNKRDKGPHLENYKGEFYGVEDVKYQDPVTGAHFEYHDICSRLLFLQRNENNFEGDAIRSEDFFEALQNDRGSTIQDMLDFKRKMDQKMSLNPLQEKKEIIKVSDPEEAMMKPAPTYSKLTTDEEQMPDSMTTHISNSQPATTHFSKTKVHEVQPTTTIDPLLSDKPKINAVSTDNLKLSCTRAAVKNANAKVTKQVVMPKDSEKQKLLLSPLSKKPTAGQFNLFSTLNSEPTKPPDKGLQANNLKRPLYAVLSKGKAVGSFNVAHLISDPKKPNRSNHISIAGNKYASKLNAPAAEKNVILTRNQGKTKSIGNGLKQFGSLGALQPQISAKGILAKSPSTLSKIPQPVNPKPKDVRFKLNINSGYAVGSGKRNEIPLGSSLKTVTFDAYSTFQAERKSRTKDYNPIKPTSKSKQKFY